MVQIKTITAGHVAALSCYLGVVALAVATTDRPSRLVLWASMGLAAAVACWVIAARRRWLLSAALGAASAVLANAVVLAVMHHDAELWRAADSGPLLGVVIPYLAVVEVVLLALAGGLGWVLRRPEGLEARRDSAA